MLYIIIKCNNILIIRLTPHIMNILYHIYFLQFRGRAQCLGVLQGTVSARGGEVPQGPASTVSVLGGSQSIEDGYPLNIFQLIINCTKLIN